MSGKDVLRLLLISYGFCRNIEINTYMGNGGWITIKTFVASDICTDSIDYAKACAQELLDKLREELP